LAKRRSKRKSKEVFHADEYDAPYMSSVWLGDKIVGETTSGGWGHRTGQSIAFAMLSIELHEPGTELEIEIYGKRVKATVMPDQPLWDPTNERLRA